MSGAIPFSFDPNEFVGKRALVTGATKGMGEAILRRLAAGGVRLGIFEDFSRRKAVP